MCIIIMDRGSLSLDERSVIYITGSFPSYDALGSDTPPPLTNFLKLFRVDEFLWQFSDMTTSRMVQSLWIYYSFHFFFWEDIGMLGKHQALLPIT